MPSETPPDPPTDAAGFLQRAGLLADLGRYDEAAAEIGFAVALDPDSVPARSTLARVHLAADRPDQALAAVEPLLDPVTTAELSQPDRVALLVVRGLALIDLRRFAESAKLATDLLATYPDDAYAQRSGAAILAGSRNGQPALDAAWRAVEVAPESAQAHLVLGLVAARLELFDLAHRAYQEALRLDPLIGEAQHDVGVINLEQRRYATELAFLAERAAAMAPPPPPDPARQERIRTVDGELRRLVLFGAGYSSIAAVVVACAAGGGSTLSRGWAVFAAVGGVLLVWRLAKRVPGRLTELLPQLMESDRGLALSVYAVTAAPVLLLCYAAIATPWLLVAVIVAATAAQFLVMRRSPPRRPPDQQL
ncbi:tetratricopeptide repeat protein [Solwaraspora sp. WMMB335]|uniref:tetratricopeptide repeat protein n=1 Tax=Solwaraspora sp. WMMB335 TaxID=3404118 RepID=UPI003B947D0F